MKPKTDIERIFKRYYEKMYNLARCIIYDDEECKDVVSDIFSKILDDKIVLLPESEERYLMQCVRYRCQNIISHKSIKQQDVNLLWNDYNEIMSDDDDKQLDRLMLIIDMLEPPLRKLILQLRFIQEMTYQEIADKTGVSKVTVYNHLSQAIGFIRKQIK